MANPKVIDPSTQYGIDYLNQSLYWLGLKILEYILKLAEKFRSFLHLRRELHYPFPPAGYLHPEVKPQKSKTLAFR